MFLLFILAIAQAFGHQQGNKPFFRFERPVIIHCGVGLGWRVRRFWLPLVTLGYPWLPLVTLWLPLPEPP